MTTAPVPPDRRSIGGRRSSGASATPATPTDAAAPAPRRIPALVATLLVATLLAGRLFKNPLGKIFAFDYKVTGTWADPKVDKTATRYETISHMDVITKGLKVMDSTAITFCMEKKLPIVVFDLLAPGNVQSILRGADLGTLVR